MLFLKALLALALFSCADAETNTDVSTAKAAAKPAEDVLGKCRVEAMAAKKAAADEAIKSNEVAEALFLVAQLDDEAKNLVAQLDDEAKKAADKVMEDGMKYQIIGVASLAVSGWYEAPDYTTDYRTSHQMQLDDEAKKAHLLRLIRRRKEVAYLAETARHTASLKGLAAKKAAKKADEAETAADTCRRSS